MENLDEIKTGWMSIGDAAKVAGFTRQNVYHYIKTRPDIRTRYVKARREIRVDDLLAAMPGPLRCAWCGYVLKDDAGAGSQGSDGICQPCLEKHFPDVAQRIAEAKR